LLAAGWACDRAGRRQTIVLSVVLLLAGSVVTAAAAEYAALVVGQLVASVACGFGLVALVYIMEISSTTLAAREAKGEASLGRGRAQSVAVRFGGQPNSPPLEYNSNSPDFYRTKHRRIKLNQCLTKVHGKKKEQVYHACLK
jgi:hypothetical protein